MGDVASSNDDDLQSPFSAAALIPYNRKIHITQELLLSYRYQQILTIMPEDHLRRHGKSTRVFRGERREHLRIFNIINLLHFAWVDQRVQQCCICHKVSEGSYRTVVG